MKSIETQLPPQTVPSEVKVLPTHFAEEISSQNETQSFAMHHKQFSALADGKTFEHLKEHLVEVEIGPMLADMGPEHFLEVSVPVVGLTDFMGINALWGEYPQQFASVLAINGFGAKHESHTEHNFPKADYVMVTDIVGNQFEVLVGEDGLVEIPEDGTGKFSVIQEITYFFSKEQILNGQGLANIHGFGAEKGSLYLLPPPGFHEGFTSVVRLAHLDEAFEKHIDFEYQVPIILTDLQVDPTPEIQGSTQISAQEAQMLKVDLEGKNYWLKKKKAFTLKVELETLDGIAFQLPNETGQLGFEGHGWEHDALSPNTFYKHFGLTEQGKKEVLHHLFNENDFMHTVIKQGALGITAKNNFNDFILSPEAMANYYELLIEGTSRGVVPLEFVFNHIPEQRIHELDSSQLSLGDHDQHVISNVLADVGNNHFESFEEAFAPASNEDAMGEFSDYFYLNYIGDNLENMPQVQVVPELNSPSDASNSFIFEDSMLFEHLIIPGPEPSSQELNLFNSPHSQIEDFINIPNHTLQYQGEVSDNFELIKGHVATTIYYNDIMDFPESGDTISGFDINADKINLSKLLENSGLHSKDVKAQTVGDDIQIAITNTQGKAMPVVTLVDANPGGQLSDDPSTFIEF